MIRRLSIPHGLYSDALPTGERATLVLDPTHTRGSHIETHLGALPLPPAPGLTGYNAIHPRVTRVPTFRIAVSVVSTDRTQNDRIWEWREGTWTFTGRLSYGVQGHIYSPEGVLHTLPPGPGQESQGFRYWDPVTGPVLGSPTYTSDTPLAQSLGVRDLFEWTSLGRWMLVPLAVGQTNGETAALLQAGAAHYLLQPGNCHFLNAHREGDRLSVTSPRFAQQDAWIAWLDVGDIPTLPRWTPPLPQEPPPMLFHKPIVTVKVFSGLLKPGWQFTTEDTGNPELGLKVETWVDALGQLHQRITVKGQSGETGKRRQVL